MPDTLMLKTGSTLLLVNDKLALNPSCCCCPKIGFDESAWGFVTSCCSGMSPIINLKTDVSRLAECKVVFGGNNGSCGNAMRFDAGDWPALKTYLENGGRMFIAGEHSGNGPGFPGFLNQCLQDMANLNSFLAFIGSSISYVGFDYNQSSPSCSASYYSPGAAAIADGITFTGERFGELSGGTTLWIGNAGSGGSGSGAGKVAACIDQIGDGFIVVTGDGNHGFCSGYCDFLKRLWEYEDDEIL